VVRGFTHSRWAVRNSAMMVFASIVQRAVDNHKGSEASARGTTARSFFARFPALLGFLLAELAGITGHAVQLSPEDGKPVGVTAVEGTAPTTGGLTPALFPILLLLGKMRPDDSLESTHTGGTGAGLDGAPVHLFIPLLEACSSLAEQKIRIAAASAVAALTVGDDAVLHTQRRLTRLVAALRDGGGRDSTTTAAAPKADLALLSANSMHGWLLTCNATLQPLIRRAKQESASAGTSLLDLSPLLPALWDALALLSARHAGRNRPYWCPPMARAFLALCRTVASASASAAGAPSSSGRDLLVAVCRWALWPVAPTDAPWEGESEGSNRALFVLPDEGNLWRDALCEMVKLRSGQSHSGAEPTTASAFEALPLSTLVSLLHHTHSEVRLGVLEGLQAALTNYCSAGCSAELREMIVVSSCLLMRARREQEPPLLRIVYELLVLLLPQLPWEQERPDGQLAAELVPLVRRTRDVLTHADMWSHLVGTVVEQPKGTAGGTQAGESVGASLWDTIAAGAASALESLSPSKPNKSSGGDSAAVAAGALRMHAVAGGALRVLGLAVSLEGASVPPVRMAQWLSLAEAATTLEQPLELRAAGATSLLYSNVLAVATAGCPAALRSVAVRVWLLALQLLQDDDSEVRDTATAFVCAHESGGDSTEGLLSELSCLDFVSARLAQALLDDVARGPDEEGTSGIDRVHGLLQQTLGRYSEVRAVVSASGRDSSTRVFEPEQHNLHVEARSAARVLSKALVTAAVSLRADSESAQETGHAYAQEARGLITGWLVVEAQNALDLLHAAGQVSFDGCSGGASFDPRVFLWCDGALYAAAQLVGAAGEEATEADALLSAVPRAAEVSAAARIVLGAARRSPIHPSLVASLQQLAL